MKIIASHDLLKWCKFACKLIPNFTPKLVLRCVKLTASDSECCLSATDLEVSLLVKLQGIQVESPGEVLLPVVDLAGALKLFLPATSKTKSGLLGQTGECVIETQSEVDCVIRSSKGSRTILGYDPEKYPLVKGAEGDKVAVVDGLLLKKAIQHTFFASSKKHSHYALAGSNWKIEDGVVRVASTDGKLLAVVDVPAKVYKAVSDTIIAGFSKLLPAFLSGEDAAIFVEPDKTVPDRLSVHQGQAVLSCCCDAGNYPDYSDSDSVAGEPFHKVADGSLTVNAKSLAEALRPAVAISELPYPEGSPVGFSSQDKELHLNCKVLGQGEVDTSCPIHAGKLPYPIEFRGSSLLRLIEHAAGETVELCFYGRKKVVAIRSDGGKQIMLLMPHFEKEKNPTKPSD